MRFVIRADASVQIGAGHVMRCCAIAEELIDRGQKVVFVGETKSLLWVQERVKTLGFSEIYNEPENFRSDSKSDVLILDSYEIDPDNDFINSVNWRWVVAIVDDATPPFRADLCIHPGPGTTWLPTTWEREVRFILGIKYIPIRKSISDPRSRYQFAIKAEPKILVVGGGSDNFDFCGAIGRILHNLTEQFSAVFFTDSSNTLPTDARFTPVNIGAKLENFLEGTDLIFTTAGTSSWELLSCGFPIGLACAVDNQVVNYQYQTEAHLALGIGTRNENNKWELDPKVIERLVTDPECRRDLADRTEQVVDGNGSARIVDEIQLLGPNLFHM